MSIGSERLPSIDSNSVYGLNFPPDQQDHFLPESNRLSAAVVKSVIAGLAAAALANCGGASPSTEQSILTTPTPGVTQPPPTERPTQFFPPTEAPTSTPPPEASPTPEVYPYPTEFNPSWASVGGSQEDIRQAIVDLVTSVDFSGQLDDEEKFYAKNWKLPKNRLFFEYALGFDPVTSWTVLPKDTETGHFWLPTLGPSDPDAEGGDSLIDTSLSVHAHLFRPEGQRRPFELQELTNPVGREDALQVLITDPATGWQIILLVEPEGVVGWADVSTGVAAWLGVDGAPLGDGGQDLPVGELPELQVMTPEEIASTISFAAFAAGQFQGIPEGKSGFISTNNMVTREYAIQYANYLGLSSEASFVGRTLDGKPMFLVWPVGSETVVFEDTTYKYIWWLGFGPKGPLLFPSSLESVNFSDGVTFHCGSLGSGSLEIASMGSNGLSTETCDIDSFMNSVTAGEFQGIPVLVGFRPKIEGFTDDTSDFIVRMLGLMDVPFQPAPPVYYGMGITTMAFPEEVFDQVAVID